jgi:anthranilate phosphoribosyltransferase
MQQLSETLNQLRAGQDLTVTQMQAAIGEFLSGAADTGSMRDFLTALARKGESTDELVGATQAMRDAMVRIHCPQRPVVDTCGTGGDGSQTFNISTAAAIVAAAAGVRVAKHGNRKITSATGSADVLAELGINLDCEVPIVERALNELGLCFCFAPRFHPAMRHVGEVRRSLSHPTIFNRLGPLCNPAMAECQVIGVGDEALQVKMANALAQLGTLRSIVVRGDDGVDELSLAGPSRVLEVVGGQVEEHRWHPNDFGLTVSERSHLFADSPESSAACIRDALSGRQSPRRDAVVINAAAALWIAGASQDLKQCAIKAQAAIDSGKAQTLVTALGQLSQGAE